MRVPLHDFRWRIAASMVPLVLKHIIDTFSHATAADRHWISILAADR